MQRFQGLGARRRGVALARAPRPAILAQVKYPSLLQNLKHMPRLEDHIHSYYSATARAAGAHPPLRGSLECDVCVVGAGIAGCSSALHLAERGYQVVLLEGRAHWLGRLRAQRRPGPARIRLRTGEDRRPRRPRGRTRALGHQRRRSGTDAHADLAPPDRLRLGRRSATGRDQTAASRRTDRSGHRTRTDVRLSLTAPVRAGGAA